MNKKCSVCHIEKPTAHFSVDKQKKDGLTSCCNDCRNSNRQHLTALKREEAANNKKSIENTMRLSLPSSMCDSMVIMLSRNKIAIVDKDDYDKLSQYKWFYYSNRYASYAARNLQRDNKTQYTQPMHREIMGLSEGDGLIVDHINMNGLDNRKINLRVVSCSLNNHHRRKQRNNTSGYRGVSWHKGLNKWQAGIAVKNKWIHLGLFSDLILAAKTRDIEAKRIFGDAAVLNFPKGE